MARTLTTSDVLDHNIGALSGMTYGTIAIIFKVAGLTGSRTILGLHTSGAVGRLGHNIDNQTLGWWNGGSYNQSGNVITSASTWYLLVSRKATGSVAPRASIYDYSTGTWTHTAIGGAIGDATAAAAGGFAEFRYEAAEQFAGDVAVRGVWSNTVPWSADTTGDNLIEAAGLQYTLTAWHASSPSALWMYDQADTTQAVPDLAGGGAQQSSITGTTITSASVPTIGYGDDLFEVLSAPAGAGSFTGTAAVTQAADTSTATGQLGYSGTSAATQAANTSSASGTVINPVTGTAAPIQAAQTANASGQLGYAGTVAQTQANQTSAATGQLGYSGTAAVTQASQVAAASGAFTPPGAISGSVAVTQANQTSAASGRLGYSGTATPSQAANTSSASGQLGYSGSAAPAQANQTAAASGQLGYSGSAAANQAAQTASASGTFTAGGSFSGTAAVTQASQTASATGQLGYSGTVTRTQANQTAAASGTVVNPVTGTASPVQANQTSAASGQLRYSGTTARTQANNTASATGTVSGPITGTVAVIQANQVAAAAGQFTPLVSAGTAQGAVGPVPTASAGTAAAPSARSASMTVPTATGG